MPGKIRLFMVDDSLFFLTVMKRELSKIEDIEIVGTARNTGEAARLIEESRPDVVTLDIEMPGEDGISFLRRFLQKNPMPFVLVSALDIRLFDALQAGAVDYVRKPSASQGIDLADFAKKLESKIRIARLARVRKPRVPLAETGELRLNKVPVPESALIVLGASTGGTEATADILGKLPSEMPPILIVQHMPADFVPMYARRLDGLSALRVKEARDGERPLPGHAYLSPGGLQMTVHAADSGYVLRCRPAPKRNGHCPSVDNLFDSAAACAGRHCMGVLLTGMGRDGAAGLLNIRRRGGHTIGQDEESCVVYGMPGEAKKLGAVVEECACPEIARRMVEHLNRTL